MTAQPPICHVPPVTPQTQPGPVSLQSIPPAQPNIASLVATVNAMRQTIIFLSGQQGRRGQQGAPGNSQKSPPARWTEAGRTTEKVKVYNPDDKTQFVEVERINSLQMKDGITGESWSWNRGH